MPIISFSNEDILRGTLVEPAWYRIKVGEFKQEMNKNNDGENYIFDDCVLLRNADTGDEKYAGVPIRILFSAKPKARGFMKGFLESLGFEVTGGARFDIAACAGKEVDAFVENNEWEGRISNRINHKYRAVR